MRRPPPTNPAPLAPSSDDAEDPFAEQPLRPVLRTEEKILAELRKQLQMGLISLREYGKAARSCVAVLTEEEALSVAIPGQTLRMVFTNERRQFESGLITEAEFARLRKAAVAARVSSGSSANSVIGTPESPRSGGREPSPRKNSVGGAPETSPRHNSVAAEVSPRKLGASASGISSPLRRLTRSDSKDSPVTSPASSERKSPIRRAPAGPAPVAPGKGKDRALETDYVPFTPNKAIAHGVAATKAGIGDAIALDLRCTIAGTAKTERRKYLGSVKSYAAFRIQVRGKAGLEFMVVRRYGEFLRVFEALTEFWPDLSWPAALPKKAAFVDTDAAMVERVAALLNSYLDVVCRHNAVVRSRVFVSFIDPKTNPQLGSLLPSLIVRQGWMRMRKAQTLAPLRRLWGVLSGRNLLYLYPSNKESAAEPFVTIVLELCTVDLVYSSQLSCEVIELDRFCVGKRYFVKPDDAVGDWLRDLRASHSKRIHSRILPLMSEEEATSRVLERREVIRKATQINSTARQVVPSLSKAYYEKDRIDHNIVFRNSSIKAATKYKLVEYLLNHQICPPIVVASFLLTFHSFMTSAELLDQLFSYFRKSPFGLRKSSGGVDQLQPEQLRVIAILQKWLGLCPSDFADDVVLRESLESFAASNNIANLLFRKKTRGALPMLRGKALSPEPKRSPPPLPPSKPRPTVLAPRARARARSNSMGDIFDALNKGQGAAAALVSSGAATAKRAKVVLDTAGTVRVTSSAGEGVVAKRRAIPDFAKAVSNKSMRTTRMPRRRNSSESVRGSRAGILAAALNVAVLPFGFFEGVPWDLFCLDVEEVSRQLSLQHQRLFVAINPTELLNQNWNKDTKQLKSPNVCLLIDTFNVLSGIVSTSVVRIEEPRERAGAIAFWIRVANAAYQHNDFSCTMAVVSGLLNSSVHRLARTWAVVKKRWEAENATFDKLVTALSSDRNYSSLRAALRAANPPTMPYLGVFLQDMTFADEGNKDTVAGADGTTRLINFEKRVQLASKIQDVLMYQSVPYQFDRVEEIQTYLTRFSPLDSERLYARSLALEPRQ